MKTFYILFIVAAVCICHSSNSQTATPALESTVKPSESLAPTDDSQRQPAAESSRLRKGDIVKVITKQPVYLNWKLIGYTKEGTYLKIDSEDTEHDHYAYVLCDGDATPFVASIYERVLEPVPGQAREVHTRAADFEKPPQPPSSESDSSWEQLKKDLAEFRGRNNIPTEDEVSSPPSEENVSKWIAEWKSVRRNPTGSKNTPIKWVFKVSKTYDHIGQMLDIHWELYGSLGRSGDYPVVAYIPLGAKYIVDQYNQYHDEWKAKKDDWVWVSGKFLRITDFGEVEILADGVLNMGYKGD